MQCQIHANHLWLCYIQLPYFNKHITGCLSKKQSTRLLYQCYKTVTGHLYQNMLQYFFISQIYHSFFNKVGAYPIFLCMCKRFSTAGLQVSRMVEVVHPCPPCPTDLTPPVSTKLDITHNMVRGTMACHTLHPTLHIGRYCCDMSQDDTTQWKHVVGGTGTWCVLTILSR